MTNLDSILKNRDITLPTKVCLAKVMVFPVVMRGCESWTIKKAEHRRIDGFELWCWRRLLRVRWTARRSNQSILKEMSPGCSLEGLMLRLKFQYWPPDVKSWFIWKDPDAGKDWGQEEKGTTEDEMVEWHHWFKGHELGWAPGVGVGQGGLACCSPWGHKSWAWLSDWTELRVTLLLIFKELPYTVFPSTVPFYVPTSSAQRSKLSNPLLKIQPRHLLFQKAFSNLLILEWVPLRGLYSIYWAIIKY